MAYEDYHVNADDVKLDGDPNIRRTVPPSPSGSGGGIAYGTCTTAGNVAVKAVTLSDATGWELKQGASVAVKFSNTNTFSATSQDPVTLNVNNTGAKNIYYGGSANPTGANTTAFGRANYVNTYVYDGTYWVWTGSSADNNTTYSAMSKSELTTGTATTSRVVRADYLKQGIEEIIEDKDTNFVGTRAEWDALSVAEKAKYLTMDFTDDGGFGDISDEDVTFTSSDVVDANANSWTVVSPIASGTTLNTLFSRVSQMFKNVRYLKNIFDKANNYSESDVIVGKWINGAPIHRRTVALNRSFNGAQQVTIDMSSWYKNPYNNPTDGMMVIRTEPFWQWDGALDASTKGCGSGCQMTSQSWVNSADSYHVDMFLNGGSNVFYVRIGGNAKIYLIAVTFWYYKFNKT